MTPSDAETAWYDALRETLEHAYLASEDLRGQSGFRGDEARWERARRVIVEAIHHDGTFLDVGCANGLLMESVARWAADDGHVIEPFGLDLSDALVRLARTRLPHWSDRIFAGNVMVWGPPRGFDFVRTELDYVPPHSRRNLVARLLERFAVPGGRVIVCSYGSSTRPSPRAEAIGETLRAFGYAVAGEADASDANGIVVTRIAWIET